MVSERKFSRNCFKNNSIFFHFPPTSSHLHPLQGENCDSNSRLVVDEDDNGKFRLERVNTTSLPVMQGFRDISEIGRNSRQSAIFIVHMWDLSCVIPVYAYNRCIKIMFWSSYKFPNVHDWVKTAASQQLSSALFVWYLVLNFNLMVE